METLFHNTLKELFLRFVAVGESASIRDDCASNHYCYPNVYVPKMFTVGLSIDKTIFSNKMNKQLQIKIFLLISLKE